MTITIRSNLAALNTQRRLGEATRALEQSFTRLSSGLRINSASDDAAGLAIAESLNTDSRVFAQGVRNLNDGASLLNIADGALEELGNIVIRLEELAQQAANGTVSNEQRKAIDEEAQELSSEYFRIARSTEFNDLNLFDGSLGELTLQAGYGTEGGVVSDLGGAVGTGTFESSVSFTTEEKDAYSVELADLNGDGILDLISAGHNSSFYETVSIQLGNEDGSFQAREEIALGSSGYSYGLEVGDVNNDGVMDIVSAGKSGDDGTATVLIGNGDGSFSVLGSYVTESFTSRAVALGDINGDGILDMATAGFNDATDGEATIFLGQGDGTFVEIATLATEGTASRAIEFGDLNGDGILDLVTAGYGGGTSLSVFMGRGNGEFAEKTSYLTDAWGSRGMAIGDVNNDGYLDIVTGGVNASEGTATVMLNQGDGTFQNVASFATEENRSNVVLLGDINGDGTLDLVTAGITSSGGGGTVFLGNADGTFREVASYSTSSTETNGGTLGDVNSDGVLDFVTVENGTPGKANVFIGEIKSGIAPLLSFSLGTQADALQALPVFQTKLDQITTQRGQIGAFQSRITVAVNTLQVTNENIKSAESRIRDVDVAQEAAELVRTQILQQAAAAVLSQANSQPDIALDLLSG